MPAFVLEAKDNRGQILILASHFERGPVAHLRRSITRTGNSVLSVKRYPINEFPEVKELRTIANGATVEPIRYVSERLECEA